MPFDSSNFIATRSSDETVALVQQIDGPANVGTPSLGFAYTLGFIAIPLIGIIVAIILLVKSIKSKNKLMQEISLNTIDHIHKKAIILLVLSIIFLSLPAIILSIISLVLTSNAQKIFDNDLETVKSKLNTACILNIISIILLAICFTLLIWIIFTSIMPILHMAFMIN